MKKILLSLFCFITTFALFSQTYNISTNNGQTKNTCSGTFYDSGGASNSYGNNENKWITFCSNSAVNTQVMLYFNSFDIHSTDTMRIHDGANTSAPLIITGNQIQNYFNNSNSLFLFPVIISGADVLAPS